MLATLCGVAHAAPVDVELLPAALVHGKAVRLGDVSRIDGADPALARALGATRLGAAPLAGYSERFSRAAIDAAIQASPATTGTALAWRGAGSVTVRRASRLVEGAELAAVARRQLESVHGARYARLALTQAGSVGDVQVPEGTLALKPRPVAGALRQRVSAWVDLLVDGAVYRSVAVSFRAEGWNEVLVAGRAMPADGVAERGDFRQELRDVLALEAPPAPVTAPAAPLRLSEAVGVGDVLLSRHVVPPGMVRRGDRVSLVTTAGPVRIETSAVAQNDGMVGAQLRVKPANGSDIVTARVVAAGMVAVEGY